MAVELKAYPQGWLPEEQYHPKEHLSKARPNSKDNDYLKVAERNVWFVQEQRQLIAAGLATCPFILTADLIELDMEHGRAVFKATARDVLGNEAIDYGSESLKDFNDWLEKAATKAQGRALAKLGYGTAFAPELDEGERIADTPKEQRHQPQQNRSQPAQPSQKASPAPAKPAPVDQRALLWDMASKIGYTKDGFDDLVMQYTYDGRADLRQVKDHLEREQAKAPNVERVTSDVRVVHEPAAPAADAPADDSGPANEQQMTSIRKLCAALGREEPDPQMLTFRGAGALLRRLSVEYNAQRRRAS